MSLLYLHPIMGFITEIAKVSLLHIPSIVKTAAFFPLGVLILNSLMVKSAEEENISLKSKIFFLRDLSIYITNKSIGNFYCIILFMYLFKRNKNNDSGNNTLEKGGIPCLFPLSDLR